MPPFRKVRSELCSRHREGFIALFRKVFQSLVPAARRLARVIGHDHYSVELAYLFVRNGTRCFISVKLNVLRASERARARRDHADATCGENPNRSASACL